jgi:outer membrane protein W
MKLCWGIWIVLSCAASSAHAGGTGAAPLQVSSLPGGGSPGRGGFYFELHGAWAELGGDFDGSTALTGASDTVFVPDAGSGTGFGLAIGRRWDRQAVELSFTQTQHDGSISGAPGGDVTYDSVDLDWRYFFRPEEKLQPFFQAGIGAAFATLEDASTNGVSVGDADLSGAELALGGGAEYYLGEHWSLGVRALYRFAFFDTAKGVSDDEGSIDNTVDTGGLVLLFGTSFTL